jgi:hypothetical protein
MALLAGTAGASALDGRIADVYGDMALAVPTPQSLVFCHGFGCKYRTVVGLEDADRKRLGQFLAAGRASPLAERRAVAAAVAWFEKRVGPETGTHRVARAGLGQMGSPAQEDCIDVSRNTTSLLLVLESLKLLRHHAVEPPSARGSLLDGRWPHATAVLRETVSGTKWVVDPWTHAQGDVPDVMPLERWAEAR